MNTIFNKSLLSRAQNDIVHIWKKTDVLSLFANNSRSQDWGVFRILKKVKIGIKRMRKSIDEFYNFTNRSLSLITEAELLFELIKDLC